MKAEDGTQSENTPSSGDATVEENKVNCYKNIRTKIIDFFKAPAYKISFFLFYRRTQAVFQAQKVSCRLCAKIIISTLKQANYYLLQFSGSKTKINNNLSVFFF